MSGMFCVETSFGLFIFDSFRLYKGMLSLQQSRDERVNTDPA